MKPIKILFVTLVIGVSILLGTAPSRVFAEENLEDTYAVIQINERQTTDSSGSEGPEGESGETGSGIGTDTGVESGTGAPGTGDGSGNKWLPKTGEMKVSAISFLGTLLVIGSFAIYRYRKGGEQNEG